MACSPRHEYGTCKRVIEAISDSHRGAAYTTVIETVSYKLFIELYKTVIEARGVSDSHRGSHIYKTVIEIVTYKALMEARGAEGCAARPWRAPPGTNTGGTSLKKKAPP